MKKRILLFFTILSFIRGVGQEIDSIQCLSKKNKAISDSKKGILKFRTHGLVKYSNQNSEKDFRIYLFSKYGIEKIDLGCIVSITDFCYTETMDSIIKNQFNSDLIRNTKTYVEQKFIKLTQIKKSKIIDLKKYYTINLLESHPKFIGNDKIIKDYLDKTFVKKEKQFYRFICLKISLIGKIVDIELPENLILKKGIDLGNLIKKLNDFGKWTPGYIYNLKVNSTTEFIF